MCKILTVLNASKLDRKELKKFIKVASKVMCTFDKDGFGWMANGKLGIYGERFLDVNKVSPLNEVVDNPNPLLVESRNSFGKASSISGALVLHARASTNHINLINTHPHMNNTWALVHNGVVSNVGEHYNQVSTCDTEHLLHHLTNGGITGMVDNVSGYYAVSAIELSTGNLLIVKDDMASLSGCYVTELESFVVSTSEEQLTKILHNMQWSHDSIRKVKSNTATLFDPTGKMLSQEVIKPVLKSYATDKQLSTAFGWDNDYPTYKRPHVSSPVIKSGITDIEYNIIDKSGEFIDEDAYEGMSMQERDLCQIVDRYTGRVIQ